MLKTRVIPCLLLNGESLVKTVRFGNPGYIGDPINTVRIFNELEVDELIFLDIKATLEKRKPDLKILSQIANECFMPLAYGGGITTLKDVSEIFSIGLEKVAINSFLFEDPDFITRVADHYGNQSVIGSIDVQKNFFGKYEVVSRSGSQKTKKNPVEWAVELEKKGAGELLVTSIDNEGTWKGYDIDLIKSITNAVKVPVIANGGASSVNDIAEVVKKGGASAAALGSMVVYQQKNMGVLINFPPREELESKLY